MEQLDKSLTARLYQAGLSEDESVSRGANREEFHQLDERFKGGSIPLHIFRGFAYTKPYSCDYHTGGARGAMLRQVAKESQEGKR